MSATAINLKALATAQAQAALAGATLQQIEADDGAPVLVLNLKAFTVQLNDVEQARRTLAELVAIGEAANV